MNNVFVYRRTDRGYGNHHKKFYISWSWGWGYREMGGRIFLDQRGMNFCFRLCGGGGWVFDYASLANSFNKYHMKYELEGVCVDIFPSGKGGGGVICFWIINQILLVPHQY